jgi:hypothetical protein
MHFAHNFTWNFLSVYILWAVVEATLNKIHSCKRHKSFENVSLLCEYLALGIKGYSAVWFCINLCARCMLNSI